MKLLYVDDKKTWHKLFETVLSLKGVEVLHAYTSKEALNVANSEKPDVAVVDVTISYGKAYDLISDLARLGIPVIVVGYEAEGFDRDRALSLGAYDTLKKPFKVEDLVELLRHIKRETPEVEEKLELVLPGEREPEVVTLEPEEEQFTLESEVPVIPVEEEVPAKEAQAGEEAVPTEETLEKVEKESAGRVKGKLEELSGVQIPEEKVEAIVREIAWEVIPEIAEKVIREEIEKLIRSRLA